MTKRMLIDSTHAEETRVVVLDGNRLEDFDVETSAKRHLKGNIYLAKIVRVEPSLQAAFVEYGGNRHGFLAFSEIHPDYYQIPVADRQRLLEMEAEAARLEEEEDELELALTQTQAEQPPVAVQPPRQGRGRRDRRRDGRNRGAQADTAIERAPEAEAWARAETPSLLAPTRSAPAALPATEAWALAATPRLVVPAEAPADEGDWAVPETPALTTPESAASEPAGIDAVAESDGAATIDGAAATEAWALAATPPLLSATPEPVWPDEFAALEPVPEPDFEAEADVRPGRDDDEDDEDAPPPETLGGDPDMGEDREVSRIPPRFLRNYKIQEVIRRRQIMLVQVVKEERGTKGAALTTYLSLAGRFSVLMPNSPRGGGISRKITSAADRRRLKEVMVELDIPRGMGMIIRTAGASRPKPEIKRDCEYLLRLWDDIREHTMKSIAPALIYEEASLIKRAIRDVYSRDIDDILVDGTEGWRAAHEFMRMLMPTHARKVQLWNDRSQPLFSRHQVESQLDAMLNPVVQLRSGGYLVINQAEALVAIDVNSGRSTRERNVEETALRTNLEAADEVARQLRLRDLAGLIVIDFIDMESRRHNAMVERRLKDALRNDRARIQVGHISHFGLLEMSRQRLRPSLTETTFVTCPHCNGTGHVRTTESAGIHVLRGIEEEASKRRAAEAIVHVATPIALYLLNHKRERLREIESRYGMRVIIAADDSQMPPRFHIERVRAQVAGETPQFITPDAPPPPQIDVPVLPVEVEDEVVEDAVQPAMAEAETETETEAEPGAVPGDAEEMERRPRRRRRRSRRDERGDGDAADQAMAEDGAEEAPARAADDQERGEEPAPHEAVAREHAEAPAADGAEDGTGDDGRGRRRGRRGGRRRRRDETEDFPAVAEPGAEQPDVRPAYSGPTPANPFGGQAFDIFDVMEQAETAAAQRTRARPMASAVVAAEPQAESWARAGYPSMMAPEPPAVVEPPPAAAPVVVAEPVATPVVEDWAQAVSPALVRPDAASEPTPAVEVVEPHVPVAVVEPEAEPPAVQPAPVEAGSTPATDDAEPVVGPAIKPVVIGQDVVAPTERKRGWWRR